MSSYINLQKIYIFSVHGINSIFMSYVMKIPCFFSYSLWQHFLPCFLHSAFSICSNFSIFFGCYFIPFYVFMYNHNTIWCINNAFTCVYVHELHIFFILCSCKLLAFLFHRVRVLKAHSIFCNENILT